MEIKNKLIRISKIISHAGICSRKEAEELIINGKVKINNKVYTDYFMANDLISSIKVNNKLISRETTRVWIFNKPMGFVSSNKEQFSQKSLFRLIPNNYPRMVSVGRLDINSDGLMIMTNNPSLANFFENPSNKIERKYLVKVFGNIQNDLLDKFHKSIIVDGILYKNVKIKKITKKNNNNILEFRLTEGKNREIRKILNYFQLRVKKLTRLSYGPFQLNKLEKGNIIEINHSSLINIFKSLKFKDENSLW